MLKYILYSLMLIPLFSCDEDRIFENNHDFPQNFWQKDSVQSFSFIIPDRNDRYTISINIRNSVSYTYRNIYVKYNLKGKDGAIVGEDMLDLLLFDPKTGRPLGRGIGNIYSHQIPLLVNYAFEEPGEYVMEFQHYMRLDSLDEIRSLGLRVESSDKDLDN